MDGVRPMRNLESMFDLECALSVRRSMSLDPDPLVRRQHRFSSSFWHGRFSDKTFRPEVSEAIEASCSGSPKHHRTWTDTELSCSSTHLATVPFERLDDLLWFEAHMQILAQIVRYVVGEHVRVDKLERAR
jgi:hypothetical protein